MVICILIEERRKKVEEGLKKNGMEKDYECVDYAGTVVVILKKYKEMFLKSVHKTQNRVS